jgi:hypothetical protein
MVVRKLWDYPIQSVSAEELAGQREKKHLRHPTSDCPAAGCSRAFHNLRTTMDDLTPGSPLLMFPLMTFIRMHWR